MISSLPKETKEKTVIVTLSSESDNSREQDFIKLGVKVECLNINGFNSIFKFKRKFNKKILRIYNPQIIHSHCLRSITFSGFFIGKEYYSIATVQNNPFQDFKDLFGTLFGRLFAILEILALKRMNKVVCCSDFVKNSIVKKVNNDVEVVYNGIISKDISDYNIVKNKNKENLGIELKSTVFIFAGSLIPRKNPIVLLKAFSKIIDKNNSIVLIMLGDGKLRKECDIIASKYEKNILLYGSVPDIFPYMVASDYYISSSLSEGMPTVVMNSMDLGLPSVLSNINPHTEMYKSLKNYPYFFKPNDEGDIEECVFKIMEADYEELTLSVKDIFMNNFSSVRMASNYQTIYDTI
jgi:glycosyltransferase involved in cell wall biosynthesis